MPIRAALAALFICLAVPAQAAGLPRPVARALAAAHVRPSQIGLLVQRLDVRRPEVSLNASAAFNPASVMKILTTLAALDSFGPSHTFTTRVWMEGTLADGVLTGNLIIQGSGDPDLNLEHFRTLLGEIRARGVRRIDGDVLLDNGFYDISTDDPGAFDGEPLKPYNAPPAALLINFNALPLHLGMAGGKITALFDPPGLAVDNRVGLDNEHPCGDWEAGLAIQRDGAQLSLGGHYSLACGDQTLWLSVLPPAETAANVFRSDWAELGGTLSGQIRSGQAAPDAVPLLDFASPPLADIVRGTNKFSNNVMAKMLFLDLGAARYGAPATWDKSRQAMREWLKEKGLAMSELVVENGSGLARNARMSARSAAKLLRWASKQPLYYEFAASLPALGLEGTQRHRLQGEPQAGHAWLKSGSLDGVHNLAGYVLDAKGRRKVLVLFIHGASGTEASRVQSAVLKWAIGVPLDSGLN